MDKAARGESVKSYLSYERKPKRTSAFGINVNLNSAKNDGNSADKDRASQQSSASKLKSIDKDSLKDVKNPKNDYMKDKKFKFPKYNGPRVIKSQVPPLPPGIN